MVKNVYYILISIALLTLSILEILIALPALALFPDIQTFTKTQCSTFCALVAGLLALPANIRSKFHIDRPHLEKLYGYTLSFKKLTILMYILIHTVAFFICLRAIYITYNKLNNFMDFTSLMLKYQDDISTKMLVDELQIVVQCCGSQIYSEWFSTKWKNDVYEEEVDTASVPYSCCRRSSSVPCGHYDLKTLGTASINHRGCAPLIKSYTLTYLWFLLILFFSNLILEILLLALYHNESKKAVVTNCDTHGSNKIEDTDITCMQYQKLSPTWESEMGCNPLMLYDDHSERKSLQEIDEIESGKNRRSRSRSPSNSKSESKTKSSSLFPSSFNSRKSTPVLTSSHKQIRILSPLQDVGNSPFVSKVRIFPRHK